MSKRLSGSVVIAAAGLFALAAQTLLFRDFFTVFEGNELGIAAFFASWLVWVAIGAYTGRVEIRLVTHFPILALAYIPSFVLQQFVILHARELAGIQSYQLFPFAKMFAMSFAVNAPVSFLTGFLFTIACRWARQHVLMPVSHVYICETFGSCLGGAGVTVLLWRGVEGEVAAICAMGILAGAAACFYLSRKWLIALFLPVFAVVTIWAGGAIGTKWAEKNCRTEWARLLPAETYQNHFSTAQGRYLYGRRDNQFIVMSNGGVCETLPAGEHAAEVAAFHLAEKPDARKIVVFGADALGLCSVFERFPQVANVTWLHPDPEYPQKIINLIGGKAPPSIDLSRLTTPSIDIRAFAQSAGHSFDLVILDMSDIDTFAHNRYYTEEFLASTKGILAANGALSVRVLGVANYAGSEIAYLGASILNALGQNFKHVVLKPGDESWFIASDGDGLTQEASALAGRFAAINGADAAYPSPGLLALFPSDRVAFQMKAYEATIAAAGDSVLRNTDRSPKALLYALLVTIKQAGWRVLAKLVPVLLKIGLGIFLLPIVIFALLRLIYMVKSRDGNVTSVFDFQFLIFSTGFASMTFSILLLFIYQGQYGSLFLDIGLLSALFMLGSFLGGAVLQRVCSIRHDNLKFVLLITLAVEIALLLAVPILASGASHVLLMALFSLCGFFTGAYFPLAAIPMQAAGRNEAITGSHLEAFDTLGGAAGAVLTGLLLLPILGGTQTTWLLALLVAANVIPIFLGWAGFSKTGSPTTGALYDRLHRPIGYALAGVALYAMAFSQATSMARAAEAGQLVQEAVRALAGSTELHEEHARLSDGKPVTYYSLWAGNNSPPTPDGYIFSSDGWGLKTRGYGGPMTLAILVDKQGNLKDYRIVHSNETPAYQSRVEAKRQRLIGRNLFAPDPFKGVDGVSGATITSGAITRLIETAGRGFAEQVLGKKLVTGTYFHSDVEIGACHHFFPLAAMALAAILCRYWPNRWARRALLLVSVAVAGYWLNAQFSMQQVLFLMQLNFGGIGLNAPFFLLVAIPLLVILFGNVYCGYLCPFGAIQDFVSDLLSERFKMNPAKKAWRYGRAAKYIVLLVIVILFALTRDTSIAQTDPLVTFFSGAMGTLAGILALAALFLSLFYNRFWCRNLCPAGAFLSLLNGVRLFRRIQPPRYPALCDLGVETNGDLDCLYCDRCVIAKRKREQPAPADGPPQWGRLAFMLSVISLAAVFLASAWSVAKIEIAQAVAASEQGIPASVGKPRDVDAEKIKRLVEEKRLSNRPADFAQPVEK